MANHSLSWFKKRTAELNRLMGTHYSPSALYRSQGTSSPILMALEQMGDPRTKGAEAVADRTEAVRALQLGEWSSFISSNATAATLAASLDDPNRRLSPNGVYMYEQIGDTWVATNLRTGASRTVQRPASGSRMVTPAVLEKELRAVSRRAREMRARSPLVSYRDRYI